QRAAQMGVPMAAFHKPDIEPAYGGEDVSHALADGVPALAATCIGLKNSCEQGGSVGAITGTIRRLVNRSGFDVIRIPKKNVSVEDKLLAPYAPVQPTATYSPWNNDRAFQATFAAIKAYTLVDNYRCFELWKLVEQAAKLESGSIIE